MQEPYLIQRCELRELREYKSGMKVSEAFKLDYMGSSEFEWGAVPACLRDFHAKMPNLYVNEVDVKGKTVYVLSTVEEADEYAKHLSDLCDNKIFLKEGLTFDKIINDETPVEYKRKTPDDYKKESRRAIRLRKQGKPIPHIVYDRGDRFWFDLENVVAFSFDKAAVQNFKEAVVASVVYMDAKKAEVN